MEGEVPDVRIRQHPLARLDARNHRVHDDNTPQAGEPFRIGERNHPAGVVTNQSHVCELECADELVDGTGEVELVAPRRR